MKALIGSWDHRPYQLLAEATALRARVRELEAQLAAANAENAALQATISDNDLEVVFSAS